MEEWIIARIIARFYNHRATSVVIKFFEKLF